MALGYPILVTEQRYQDARAGIDTRQPRLMNFDSENR